MKIIKFDIRMIKLDKEMINSILQQIKVLLWPVLV